MISAIVKAIASALFGALAKVGLDIKRDADKKRAGRNEQELHNRNEVDAAEDRMRSVEGQTTTDVDDALRGGKF